MYLINTLKIHYLEKNAVNFLELLHKQERENAIKKRNLQQNTICLDAQIYTIAGCDDLDI